LPGSESLTRPNLAIGFIRRLGAVLSLRHRFALDVSAVLFGLSRTYLGLDEWPAQNRPEAPCRPLM
jgi:hypothetical protein